jgi:phage terminase small subunit
MPRYTAGLSPKQQRFVEEYLIDLNATQAAIRAGYSAARASVQGSENVANRKIQDAIALRQVALADANAVTPSRVIEELAHVGFAAMTTYMHWGPDGVRLKDSDTLTPAQCRVVAEVSETTTKDGGTIRVKLHNKLTALEKLGERLGLWKTAQGDVTVNQYVLTWLSKPSP